MCKRPPKMPHSASDAKSKLLQYEVICSAEPKGFLIKPFRRTSQKSLHKLLGSENSWRSGPADSSCTATPLRPRSLNRGHPSLFICWMSVCREHAQEDTESVAQAAAWQSFGSWAALYHSPDPSSPWSKRMSSCPGSIPSSHAQLPL